MKKLRISILIGLPVVALVVYSSTPSYRYNVVIDPGHGGLSLNPVSLHGDKYDPVHKKYLSAYQQGAEYKKLHESEIAYEISLQIQEFLELTHSESGREQFHKILLKYDPKAELPREPIGVSLSRSDGYRIKDSDLYEGKTDKDYNAPFRLFDFPEFSNGKRTPGIISNINYKKPDLVVSLHLDGEGPTYGALAPVVTPGYETYKQALDYVNGDPAQRKKIQREFMKSPYLNWIQMNGGRTAFEWFLCDAWIYFTGYWSYKNGLNPDPASFKGIRQDYVDWKYQGKSWSYTPEDKINPAMPHLKDFKPTGAFWEREMSEPEKWKREDGTEGVGGDNLYSANEILRFIKLGLIANKAMPEKQLPDIREPHWSTWSVPTYINAINAFLELGFLNNRYDRERISKLKKIHAEAIAVGIYSLLYGMHAPDHKIKDMPTGKALNLERYKTYKGTDYFKSVLP